jgi:hypothetical protein
MTIPLFKFNEKMTTDDMLKCHLYFSCIKKGFIPEKGEVELLIYLYNFGPIDSKEKNKEFLKTSVEKGIRASEASARNVLSKYTCYEILIKEGNSKRRFNYDIVPKELNSCVFQYFITNFDLNGNRT